MAPIMTRGVTGPASLLPYAIDPAVLAGLQAGQVIDFDPALGFQTSVAFVGQADGRNVVVISQGSQGNPSAGPHEDAMYDTATGLLIREKIATRLAVTDMLLVGAN
jgi:hypothetical protein